MNAAAEFVDLAAVALRRPAFGHAASLQHHLAFKRDRFSCGAAFVRFAIERLGDGGRASHCGELQDLNLEDAGLVGDTKTVADAHVTRCLRPVRVGFDATDIAGVGGERSCLEETRCPQPFIDAYSIHALHIFA